MQALIMALYSNCPANAAQEALQTEEERREINSAGIRLRDIVSRFDNERIPVASDEDLALLGEVAAELGGRALRLGVPPRGHFHFSPLVLAAYITRDNASRKWTVLARAMHSYETPANLQCFMAACVAEEFYETVEMLLFELHAPVYPNMLHDMCSRWDSRACKLGRRMLRNDRIASALDLNVQPIPHQRTILHWLVMGLQYPNVEGMRLVCEMVELLVARGANPRLTNSNRATPVQLLLQFKPPDQIQWVNAQQQPPLQQVYIQGLRRLHQLLAS